LRLFMTDSPSISVELKQAGFARPEKFYCDRKK
jgi:hypothetical protein